MVRMRRILEGGRALTGALALALVLGGGAALAECQPGQLQEANLAYQSAKEFLDAQSWDQALARLQSIVGVCPEHVEATRGIGKTKRRKQNGFVRPPICSAALDETDCSASFGGLPQPDRTGTSAFARGKASAHRVCAGLRRLSERPWNPCSLGREA